MKQDLLELAVKMMELKKKFYVYQMKNCFTIKGHPTGTMWYYADTDYLERTPPYLNENNGLKWITKNLLK